MHVAGEGAHPFPLAMSAIDLNTARVELIRLSFASIIKFPKRINRDVHLPRLPIIERCHAFPHQDKHRRNRSLGLRIGNRLKFKHLVCLNLRSLQLL
jgi:hypothetical protein